MGLLFETANTGTRHIGRLFLVVKSARKLTAHYVDIKKDASFKVSSFEELIRACFVQLVEKIKMSRLTEGFVSVKMPCWIYIKFENQVS